MEYWNSDYYVQNQNPPLMNDLSYLNYSIPQPDYSQVDYSNPNAGKRYVSHEPPVAVRNIPTSIAYLDDFPGVLNFQVTVSTANHKKGFVFSKKLSKVYLNMDRVLPLDFTYTLPFASSPSPTFYLRTAMVFRDDSERSKIVQRCYAHRAVDETKLEPGEKQVPVMPHVFRPIDCDSGVIYQEDQNGVLSTISPLTDVKVFADGKREVERKFKFDCKNSCPTGINRRPTKMVFALEDEVGAVLGRSSLQVQICSCPKRDMDKEEKEETPSALHSAKRAPKASKSTSDDDKGQDLNVYSINLEVMGEKESREVLKYAYDLMNAQVTQTGNEESFRPHIDELLRQIREFDSTT